MEYGECSSCGRKIIWAMNENFSRIPLDATAPTYELSPDGDLAKRANNVYVSHFSTCPNANNHSRKVDRTPPAQRSLFSQSGED